MRAGLKKKNYFNKFLRKNSFNNFLVTKYFFKRDIFIMKNDKKIWEHMKQFMKAQL